MVPVFSLMNIFKKLQFVQLKENDSKALSQQIFHLFTGKEYLCFLGSLTKKLVRFYRYIVVL